MCEREKITFALLQFAAFFFSLNSVLAASPLIMATSDAQSSSSSSTQQHTQAISLIENLPEEVSQKKKMKIVNKA